MSLNDYLPRTDSGWFWLGVSTGSAWALAITVLSAVLTLR